MQLSHACFPSPHMNQGIIALIRHHGFLTLTWDQKVLQKLLTSPIHWFPFNELAKIWGKSKKSARTWVLLWFSEMCDLCSTDCWAITWAVDVISTSGRTRSCGWLNAPTLYGDSPSRIFTWRSPYSIPSTKWKQWKQQMISKSSQMTHSPTYIF